MVPRWYAACFRVTNARHTELNHAVRQRPAPHPGAGAGALGSRDHCRARRHRPRPSATHGPIGCADFDPWHRGRNAGRRCRAERHAEPRTDGDTRADSGTDAPTDARADARADGCPGDSSTHGGADAASRNSGADADRGCCLWTRRCGRRLLRQRGGGQLRRCVQPLEPTNAKHLSARLRTSTVGSTTPPASHSSSCTSPSRAPIGPRCRRTSSRPTTPARHAVSWGTGASSWLTGAGFLTSRTTSPNGRGAGAPRPHRSMS